jgi:hypothetical protein
LTSRSNILNTDGYLKVVARFVSVPNQTHLYVAQPQPKRIPKICYRLKQPELDLDHPRLLARVVVPLHLTCPIVTTFWTSLILAVLHPTRLGTLVLRSAPRSIRQPSSAVCALRDSRAPTISAPIFARTRTNVPSFAVFAEKLSPASTTASVTRVCTLAKRNSFAEAVLKTVRVGVVAAVSHGPMRSVVISEAKLAVSASSRSLTKKPLSACTTRIAKLVYQCQWVKCKAHLVNRG